jgi:hypothetical protein
MRTLSALRSDSLGSKLDKNLEPLLGDHPSEAQFQAAYQGFTRASPTHVYRLGPAFFTKVVYFAGYRRGAGGIQPLILDRVVAGCLPPDAGLAHARTWGWPSTEWLAYLRWAAAQATLPEFGGEPEAVEIALFKGTWRPE